MSKPWNDISLDQWLYNLEHRHQQEIQLGLSRILEVAKILDLLNPKSKVITVTGTNGKGSTIAALERIYHTAGYQVGTYTSPHLLTFNERIRVNLQSITDEELCSIFRIIKEARESIALTYFEMATLAALWHFNTKDLDIILLEVGIGGRLDATNIIDPDLAIITTVDYDHQDFLGDTLEAIGYEKAGILRDGIPFIYADSNPPSSVIEAAKKLHVKGFFYSLDPLIRHCVTPSPHGWGERINDLGGEGYSLSSNLSSWEITFLDQQIRQIPLPKIQLKSAAAAILASQLLGDTLPVSPETIHTAMETVFIPGRLQLIPGDINLLYDVSHNPQSASLLARRLEELKPKGKVHAVFSALKDKDIAGLIHPLKGYIDFWYPAQLDCKRAASSYLLLSKFKDAEINVNICYNSPQNAFEAAINQAQTGDLIVVFGSFYTVGQVMASQNDLLIQCTV